MLLWRMQTLNRDTAVIESCVEFACSVIRCSSCLSLLRSGPISLLSAWIECSIYTQQVKGSLKRRLTLFNQCLSCCTRCPFCRSAVLFSSFSTSPRERGVITARHRLDVTGWRRQAYQKMSTFTAGETKTELFNSYSYKMTSLTAPILLRLSVEVYLFGKSIKLQKSEWNIMLIVHTNY